MLEAGSFFVGGRQPACGRNTLVLVAILTLASRQAGRLARANCKISKETLAVRQTGCHALRPSGSDPNDQVSRQSEEEKSELDIDAARHVV